MSIRVGLLVVVMGLFISLAGATDYTWTAGSSTWNTPANWNPNSNYPQAGDAATFTNGGDATIVVTLNGGQAVSNLVFPNRGRATHTLGGVSDTLTLGGALNYTNPGTLTISAILAGTGVLNINPSGRTELGDIGYVRLSNAANTFNGSINVRGGRLDYASDAALGNAGNVITVGSPGAYGKIGPSVTLSQSRNFTLTDKGAYLAGPGSPGWTNSGVISGTGEAIIASDSDIFLRPTTANTYSGGTRVWRTFYAGRRGWDSATVLTTNQVLGVGDVRVEYGNMLYLATNSNMSAGAKVHLASNLLDGHAAQYFAPVSSFNSVIMSTDSMPAFTSNSTGAICFDGTTGNGFNSRLTNGAPLLGTGYIWIGSRLNGTLTATTLNPNPDRVFRFGGVIYGNVILSANPGPLQDYGGQKHSVEAMGYTIIQGRNTYSGDTTIGQGKQLQATSQAGAGNSPLGSTNASVFFKPGSQLKFGGNVVNAQPMAKSNFVFEGTGSVWLDGGDAPNYLAKIQVNNLVRVGNSTLYVTGQRGRLGLGTTNEHLYVLSNPPVSASGMVSPIYTKKDSYDFLDYQANGFISAASAYYAASNDASFAAAPDTAIVTLTGAATAGTKTVYALRSNSALSGGPVTITSGGLITYAAVTHTASFVFPTEPVIYCRVANSVINGTITSANGLTKSGDYRLKLGGNNSGLLSGPITINEGILEIDTFTNQLGLMSNPIVLNGGTLSVIGINGVITNPITMNAAGGLISGSASLNVDGKITGPGLLALTHNNLHIRNTNNDYTGGTVVAGTLRLEENGKLGSGPVRVTGTLYTLIQNTTPDNLNSNQQIGVYGNGYWLVQVKNGTHMASMVEGNGTIKLSNNDPAFGVPTTLVVGIGNASSEFDGSILDAAPPTLTDRGIGRLTKLGTGTFTIGGYCTYRGVTRVENGSLLVNGTIDNAGTVTVVSVSGSVPVLGGNGVVKSEVQTTGGHIAPGASVGTLTTGKLTMDAASSLDIEINGPAASQCDLLNVNGTVSLGGAALNVILGYPPAIGQSFTILNNLSGSAIATLFAGTGVVAPYGGRNYYFSVNYQGGDGNDIVLTRLVTGSVMTIR
jgi:autotransporter-associated beta strand protein